MRHRSVGGAIETLPRLLLMQLQQGQLVRTAESHKLFRIGRTSEERRGGSAGPAEVWNGSRKVWSCSGKVWLRSGLGLGRSGAGP